MKYNLYYYGLDNIHYPFNSQGGETTQDQRVPMSLIMCRILSYKIKFPLDDWQKQRFKIYPYYEIHN